MQATLKNNGTDTLEAKVLTISKKGLLLSIPAGDFYLPFDLYPWFEKAKIKDVFDVKMDGDDAVRWEALDVDLEVEGLLNPEKYPLIAKQ